MIRYDYEYLKNFVHTNHVVLNEDYSKKTITRDSIISGKCISCENHFSIVFRSLIKHGPYCKTHKNIIKKEKTEKTCIDKYGTKSATSNEQIQEKIKQTNLEKYGVERPSQSSVIQKKIKQTNLEKYGVDHTSKLEKIKEKQRKKMMEKREALFDYFKKNGFELLDDHYNQSDTFYDNVKREDTIYFKCKCGELSNKVYRQIKEVSGLNCHTCTSKNMVEKQKVTMLEKYGVEHAAQNTMIQEKTKQTMLEKYGVEHAAQNTMIQEKTKQTNLQRHGCEYPQQNKEIHSKTIKSNLLKFGVNYPYQNADFAEKASKNAYKLKEFTFPSGKKITCQGYEPFALKELLENNIQEDDIITGCKNVPVIKYGDNNERRHYVDIFVKSLQKCIEVKSTWTFEKKKDLVLKKQESAKKNGLNYEIWVYNQKGKKLLLFE